MSVTGKLVFSKSVAAKGWPGCAGWLWDQRISHMAELVWGDSSSEWRDPLQDCHVGQNDTNAIDLAFSVEATSLIKSDKGSTASSIQSHCYSLDPQVKEEGVTLNLSGLPDWDSHKQDAFCCTPLPPPPPLHLYTNPLQPTQPVHQTKHQKIPIHNTHLKELTLLINNC